MHSLLLLLALSAIPGPAAREHGLNVPAPEGWKVTQEGTTHVFTAPSGNAVVRVDLYQKEKAGPAKDCVGQIVEKLGGAEQPFTPLVVDGQPAALQASEDRRRQKIRRVVGCNGRSYFLIDWLDVGAASKNEEAFATLLKRIRYEAIKEPARPAKKGAPEAAEPLAPLEAPQGGAKGSK